MPKVILTCGKICSGKTTYAKRLRDQRKAVLLSVDEITLALFGQHCGDDHDIPVGLFYFTRIDKQMFFYYN